MLSNEQLFSPFYQYSKGSSRGSANTYLSNSPDGIINGKQNVEPDHFLAAGDAKQANHGAKSPCVNYL